MNEPSVIHSTFTLERSYPAPPERVFAAFADPAARRRWFAQGSSHTVEEFATDFRAGGAEHIVYRFAEASPLAGQSVTSDATYLDIVENSRLVTISTMAFGEKPFSASLVTIELLATGKGTDLICTHQGAFFEGSDGPQRREAGWRKLLGQLAAEFPTQ
jgi:uncharacterized protein YndB with AHSA1/START domain